MRSLTKKMMVAGVTFGSLLAAGCGDNTESDPCDSLEPGEACTWAGIKNERGGLEEEGTFRTTQLLNFVIDLTFTKNGEAYVADFNNHRIRRIDLDGNVTTIFGAGIEGDGDPDMADLYPLGNAAGAPALDVSLNHPSDILFSADEKTLYLAAWHNNKIRQMDMTTGVVTVLAGNSYGFGGDDGPAYMATFNQPKAMVLDDAGNLITTDQRNQRVREISDLKGTPMIKTIAGTGMPGFAGDGGDAMLAQFSWDTGTTPVPSGGLAIKGRDLYIADTKNHRIRLMNLDTKMITTIAGTGTAGYAGDGGAAINAQFNEPLDLEFGPDGRLYIVDSLNNAVRAMDLATGTIELVAGTAAQCEKLIYCYEQTEHPTALEVQLLQPWGVDFSPAGDLYIADTNNQRIVKVKR